LNFEYHFRTSTSLVSLWRRSPDGKWPLLESRPQITHKRSTSFFEMLMCLRSGWEICLWWLRWSSSFSFLPKLTFAQMIVTSEKLKTLQVPLSPLSWLWRYQVFSVSEKDGRSPPFFQKILCLLRSSSYLSRRESE
jgi:hypothetical protein